MMFVRGHHRFDMPALIRLTSWGAGAALALALAVMSGVSSSGAHRVSVAVAALTGQSEPQRQVTAAQLIPRSADIENETRRLNEAIRLLAADRDRLQTRIGSIERNLDDMTGSVNRQAASSRPPGGNSGSPPLPQISSLQPDAAPAAPNVTAPGTTPTVAAPANPPAASTAPASVPTWAVNTTSPWPGASAAPVRTAAAPPAATGDAARSASVATKTEFGVDIGSGATMDEARALWTATKAKFPSLLNALRPIVAVRENRSGEMDLRVIVGPLSNAAAAAKLCAALGAADVLCAATAFEGQRLAIR
jgi:hypothetical protein